MTGDVLMTDWRSIGDEIDQMIMIMTSLGSFSRVDATSRLKKC
jgi:hypothetical protein